MNDSSDALQRACVAAGLDAEGARLLRVGSNAVYRLKEPVIVRVSRPGVIDQAGLRGPPQKKKTYIHSFLINSTPRDL